MALTCPRRMQEFGPWLHEPNQDQWRPDGTCSFCGSLNPRRVFELIERGEEIGPTDKSYKAYLHAADAEVRGAGKVYFQHFSESERKRFKDLLNAGKVKIGYPGYFYVLPFFLRYKPEEEEV